MVALMAGLTARNSAYAPNSLVPDSITGGITHNVSANLFDDS
jgi:hypothetical protein